MTRTTTTRRTARLTTLTAAAGLLLLAFTAACSSTEPAAEAAAPAPVHAQAAPDAPTTAAAPAPIDAPASPAAAEPARPRPEPALPADHSMEVVQAVAALGVTDRLPVGADTAFTVSAGEVYAHVTLRNMEEPTEVQMVWKRDGKVSTTVTLPVGTSPRWRTWSKKRLRAWDTGAWTVEILSAEGELLHTLRFDVHEAAPLGHAGSDDEEEGC